MSKRQKVTLIAVFAAVLVAVGVIAGVLGYQKTQEGKKSITVEIVSERDAYSFAEECTTEEVYLGDFLRTYEDCIWEDSTYGFYLIGFQNAENDLEMKEDLDNQYWWCVLINGESATSGAEQIAIEDGAAYRFELMHGW